MDATRISDRRPVMLKRLLTEEGPYELQMNRHFSTEPFYSNPRNPYICLMSSSCQTNLPFWCTPFSVSRFVNTRFKSLENSSLVLRRYARWVFCALDGTNPITKLNKGVHFMHENHVAHRSVHHLSSRFLQALTWPKLETVLLETSCLTHQICILNHFTLCGLVGVRIFVTRQKLIRRPEDLRGTFSSTSVFPAIMIPPMDRHSTSHSAEATNLRPNTRTARQCAIRFPQMYTISETWFENIL